MLKEIKLEQQKKMDDFILSHPIFYKASNDLALILNKLITKVGSNHYPASLFYNDMKNSYISACLSLLMKNHNGFNLYFRRLLESGILSCYSISHPGIGVKNGEIGKINNKTIFEWFEKKYSMNNLNLKLVKDSLNDNYIHSSLFNIRSSVYKVSEENFYFGYFDILNESTYKLGLAQLILNSEIILNCIINEIKENNDTFLLCEDSLRDFNKFKHTGSYLSDIALNDFYSS